MTELITSGTGEHEVTADEAAVRVTVLGRGRDRAGAVADLRSRAAGVERAVEAVEVTSRRLRITEDWRSKRRTGARATLALSLTVPPGDALSALLTALVEADAESVDGPTWRLRDRAGAEREAQRLAVAQARTRAEGYAEACGMRLGALLRLTDGRGAGEVVPMMLARSADPATDVAELHLEPEPVTVTATCTATWELLA